MKWVEKFERRTKPERRGLGTDSCDLKCRFRHSPGMDTPRAGETATAQQAELAAPSLFGREVS
jgi:hypothetical protein